MSAVRFLEDRVRRDPGDFIACNKLAGYYVRLVRETGSLDYLELALGAARASLDAMPAEMNTGGLAALAQAEYMAHDFAGARDKALRLAELDPSKPYPYQLLGDALLELGAYDDARLAFKRMEQLGGRGISGLTRTARVELLYGETGEGRRRLELALDLALADDAPDRETVSWCRWQLGEVAFSTGDYEEAERRYGEALATLPDYFRALASLGRLRAARGDSSGAIACYERALRIVPDPTFAAALGDLYALAGREREAGARYALVEHAARLGALDGELHNRAYALFLADHDLKPAEAYELAAREYAVRKDVYGADALAWTALKAGRIAEARAAIGEALRLGTKDARLFYHAGLIALAAGDAAAAREHLGRALALCPEFDPLQAGVARRALAEIS
jgi:tetratricopeptide (TPR) repeat protein